MTGASKKQKVAENSVARRNREDEGVAEGHRDEGKGLGHADDRIKSVPEDNIDANGDIDYKKQLSAVAAAALVSPNNPDPARISRTLKEVSENFLAEYCCRDEETEIDVDAAAKVICASKRRIYDVVNVLSGLGLVVKSQKGRYTWRGYSLASKCIDDIVEKHRKLEQEEAERKSCSNESNVVTMQLMPSLTEKFIFKIVSSPDKRIELEEAAFEFMGVNEDEKKTSKARVRRLYDIANVIQTLGIIEKSKYVSTRSAVFIWKGIDKLAQTLKDARKFNPEAAVRHVIRPKRPPPLENPSIPYMQGFFPFMPTGYETVPMMHGQGYGDGLFQPFPVFGPDMLQPFAFPSPMGEQTYHGRGYDDGHYQPNHNQQGVGHSMETHPFRNSGDSGYHQVSNRTNAPPGFTVWPEAPYDPYIDLTQSPGLPNIVPQQLEGQPASYPRPLNGIASEFVQGMGRQDGPAVNYDLQMQYMNMCSNFFRNAQSGGMPPNDARE